MSDQDNILPGVDDLIESLEDLLPSLPEIGVAFTIARIFDGADLVLLADILGDDLLESVSCVNDDCLADILLCYTV